MEARRRRSRPAGMSGTGSSPSTTPRFTAASSTSTTGCGRTLRRTAGAPVRAAIPPANGGVPCPSGDPPVSGQPFTCLYGDDPSDYQTDVFRDMAVEAIHRVGDAGGGQTPFFLNVDFNAPHSPYVPAPRHQGTLAGAPLAPEPGTNENNTADKPFFLRRLPRLGNGKLVAIDNRRRARLEMLRSVDDAVNSIVQALAAEGQLDNTYIVFTSDNGYFSGEHRIRQGKYLP